VGQNLLLRAGIQKTSLRPDRKEESLKTGRPVCTEANGQQECPITGDLGL
jgi:hypothetical protein